MNLLKYQKQNRWNRKEYMHNVCIYMYVYPQFQCTLLYNDNKDYSILLYSILLYTMGQPIVECSIPYFSNYQN